MIPDLQAQEIVSRGSRSQALAGIYSPMADAWSVFGNQAGMADLNSIRVGGAVQNRFLVKELSTNACFVAVPVLGSTFAVSYCLFGKNQFRQEKAGFAYARRLGKYFKSGVNFNYYRLFLSEENRWVGTSGIELGIQYEKEKQFAIGMHLTNPYHTEIKMMSRNYHYQSSVIVGVLYHVSESYLLMTELENDFEGRLKAKAAMEYKLLSRINLRTGVSANPFLFSAGFGFLIGRMTIDMATSYQQVLGNSPSVSFHYQF